MMDYNNSDDLSDAANSIPDGQSALAQVYETVFGEANSKALVPVESQPRNGHSRPPLTDAQIIELASHDGGGARFSALFSGNISGYDSHSNADLAFIGHLLCYTGDEEQIDRIMRASGLCRDKWLKRPDYRSRTIQKALSGQSPRRVSAKVKRRVGSHNTGPQRPDASTIIAGEAVGPEKAAVETASIKGAEPVTEPVAEACF